MAKKSASTKAGKYVEKEMHAMKRGSKRVKSRKQAIAVGLSEARRAGVKVKGKPNRSSSSKKKSASRKSSGSRSTRSTGSKSRSTRSAGGRKKSSSRSRSK
jgi:hypothetical protein